jgi:hypothetical protein
VQRAETLPRRLRTFQELEAFDNAPSARANAAHMAAALVEARDRRFESAEAPEIPTDAEWPVNRLGFERLAEGLVAALRPGDRAWR